MSIALIGEAIKNKMRVVPNKGGGALLKSGGQYMSIIVVAQAPRRYMTRGLFTVFCVGIFLMDAPLLLGIGQE